MAKKVYNILADQLELTPNEMQTILYLARMEIGESLFGDHVIKMHSGPCIPYIKHITQSFVMCEPVDSEFSNNKELFDFTRKIKSLSRDELNDIIAKTNDEVVQSDTQFGAVIDFSNQK